MRRCMTIVFAFLFASVTLARDSTKELTIDLTFSPQEGVKSDSPDLTTAVLAHPIAFRVEDGRGGDRSEIGQGTNDDDQRFPIRAATDLIGYLTDTIKQVAAEWGMKSAEKPDRVLTFRVTRFFVDESNKAVGSVYAAEVKFTYVLVDGSGKQLMEGDASGSSHRYGRARSSDNCNEVLSDSLKEALTNALSDARLQEAWSSGQSATGATKSSEKGSVEERLQKLDELLKKGLITKDEYDKKRAEILKDI